MRSGRGLVLGVVGYLGEMEGVTFVDRVSTAEDADGRGVCVTNGWAGFGFGHTDGVTDGASA